MPSRGERSYRLAVRAAVRGLWTGVFDFSQAYMEMESSIKTYLEWAWREGSEECGILQSEWTMEEWMALRDNIGADLSYLTGFLAVVEQNSRAKKGKLGPLLMRAEMWINRYADARNQAKRMACGNRKLVWMLGPTRDRCRDCLRLAGRVYRAKTWEKWDVRPQSSALACGGWRCLCFFELTDEPYTPGHPPKLSGQ